MAGAADLEVCLVALAERDLGVIKPAGEDHVAVERAIDVAREIHRRVRGKGFAIGSGRRRAGFGWLRRCGCLGHPVSLSECSWLEIKPN
jgi:hypothetical protein